MKTYYVHTNMGYCGTDDIMEIEAASEEEAFEQAYQDCVSMISVTVCETEEEASDYGY